MSGERVGRARFTDREDLLLMKYIATHNPCKEGRLGNLLYQWLCDPRNIKKWPFAANHPWSSWQNRYKTYQTWFDSNIVKYQTKHDIDPNGPPLYTRLNMGAGTKGRTRKEDGDSKSSDLRGDTAPEYHPRKDGSKRKGRTDCPPSYPVPPTRSPQEKPKIVTKVEEEDDGASGRPPLSSVDSAPSRKAKGKARAVDPPSSDIEETAMSNSHTSGYDRAVERRALRRAAKQSSQPGPSQSSAPSTSQRADEVQTAVNATESPPLVKPRGTSFDAARAPRQAVSKKDNPMSKCVPPPLHDYRNDIYDKGETESEEENEVAPHENQDHTAVEDQSAEDIVSAMTSETSVEGPVSQPHINVQLHTLEPPPSSFPSSHIITSTQKSSSENALDPTPQLPEWNSSQLHPGAFSQDSTQSIPLTQEPTPPASRPPTENERDDEPTRFTTFPPSSPSPDKAHPNDKVSRTKKPPQLKEGPFNSAFTDRRGLDRITRNGRRSGSVILSPSRHADDSSEPEIPDGSLAEHQNTLAPRAQHTRIYKPSNVLQPVASSSRIQLDGHGAAPSTTHLQPPPQPPDIFSQPPEDNSLGVLSILPLGREHLDAYLPEKVELLVHAASQPPLDLFSQLPVDEDLPIVQPPIERQGTVKQDEHKLLQCVSPAIQPLDEFGSQRLPPTVVASSLVELNDSTSRENEGFADKQVASFQKPLESSEVIIEVNSDPVAAPVLVVTEPDLVYSDDDLYMDSVPEAPQPSTTGEQTLADPVRESPTQPQQVVQDSPTSHSDPVSESIHNAVDTWRSEIRVAGASSTPNVSPLNRIGPFRAPVKPFQPPRSVVETALVNDVEDVSSKHVDDLLPQLERSRAVGPSPSKAPSPLNGPRRISDVSQASPSGLAAESSRVALNRGVKRRRSTVTFDEDTTPFSRHKRPRFSLPNPASRPLPVRRSSTLSSLSNTRVSLSHDYVPEDSTDLRRSLPGSAVDLATSFGIDIMLTCMAETHGLPKDVVRRMVQQFGDWKTADRVLGKMRKAAEETATSFIEALTNAQAADLSDNEDEPGAGFVDEDGEEDGYINEAGVDQGVQDEGDVEGEIDGDKAVNQSHEDAESQRLSPSERPISAKGKARASAIAPPRPSPRISSDFGLIYTPSTIEPADVSAYSPPAGLRAAQARYLVEHGRLEKALILEQRRVSRGSTVSPAKSSRLNQSFTPEDVFGGDHKTVSPSRSGGVNRSLLASDHVERSGTQVREPGYPDTEEGTSDDNEEVNVTLGDISLPSTSREESPSLPPSQLSFAEAEAASSPPRTPPTPPMQVSQVTTANSGHLQETPATQKGWMARVFGL